MDVREKSSNGKRLIDANELLKNGIHVSYGFDNDGMLLIPMGDVIRSIKEAPTVDAVSVVRCKECVWSHMSTDPRTLHSAMVCGYKGYNPVQSSQVTDNDFCSHGEREEGAD